MTPAAIRRERHAPRVRVQPRVGGAARRGAVHRRRHPDRFLPALVFDTGSGYLPGRVDGPGIGAFTAGAGAWQGNVTLALAATAWAVLLGPAPATRPAPGSSPNSPACAARSAAWSATVAGRPANALAHVPGNPGELPWPGPDPEARPARGPAQQSGPLVPDRKEDPLTLGYPVVQHELGNGLRVVVSEDHASPSATVHLHYDVGSRHEAPGRTGMAHLFEHLMFSGSRNVAPEEHAALMNACGALFNAGTHADATVYFQHLPAGGLELALWLEADRMATLADGLTQERLDAERGVIIQEKHQRYDVPFGSIGPRLDALVYPSGHPYHHPVIGSLDDLGAATLDDVAGFFRTWYAPGNAVLAVTGDVTAGHVLDAAERYFGPVPAGPLPPHVPVPVLKAAPGQARDDAFEAVPFGVTALGFRLPPNSVTDPEIFAADLGLRILAGGAPSRAHQVLVRELRYAHQVAAQTDPRTGGNSLGIVTVQAMPGVPGGLIEKALTTDLELLAEFGPGKEELACARAAAERQMLASLSGCAGRAAALAGFTVAFGDPALVNTLPGRIAAVTPDQVRNAAARWLRPGSAAVVTTRP
ncbi:MAG: insulinase family protein, partial [Trebonia sp.]